MPGHTSWEALPSEILEAIFLALGPAGYRRARSVCRTWCLAATASFSKVTVSVDSHGLELFASDILRLNLLTHQLTSLEISNRPSNQNLQQLSCGLPRLTSISITDASGLSDQGLRSLSALDSLTSLSICRGNKLSSKGLAWACSGGSALKQLTALDCSNISWAQAPLMPQLQRLCITWSRKFMNAEVQETSAIAALPNLTDLSICHCVLMTDVGLQAIAAASNLQRLHLAELWSISNRGLQQLAQLQQLQELSLSGLAAHVSDPGIKALTALRHLSQLNLSGDTICVKTLQESLPCFSQLKSLTLGCAEWTDLAMSSLTALEHLTSFHLLRCRRTTGAAFRCFSQGFGLLRTVCVEDGQGIQASSVILHAGAHAGLECIKLKGLKFGLLNRNHIRQLNCAASLSVLHLLHCPDLTDFDLMLLINALPMLWDLQLNCCFRLTDVSASHACALQQLRCLDLGSTSVTGQFAASLTGLQHLTQLSLEQCENLNAEGATALAQLEHVTHLDMRQCNSLRPVELLTISYGIACLSTLDLRCYDHTSPELLKLLPPYVRLLHGD